MADCQLGCLSFLPHGVSSRNKLVRAHSRGDLHVPSAAGDQTLMDRYLSELCVVLANVYWPKQVTWLTSVEGMERQSLPLDGRFAVSHSRAWMEGEGQSVAIFTQTYHHKSLGSFSSSPSPPVRTIFISRQSIALYLGCKVWLEGGLFPTTGLTPTAPTSLFSNFLSGQLLTFWPLFFTSPH